MNRDLGRPQTLTRRAGAPTGDKTCADGLTESAVPARQRLAVRRPVAFWIVAYLFAAIMLGTTLPTPLYQHPSSSGHKRDGR
jgi:hypothetical protein